MSVQLHSPYPREGRWVKGQLHAHTRRSDGRLSPEELLEAYRARGFEFVCLTDHDRLNAPARVVEGVLVPPGEESTVGPGWLPIGAHLLRLFVERPLPRRGLSLQARLALTQEEGGLAAACHPLWPGNLGTGRWRADQLLDPRLRLLEIVNHHAPVEPTLALWDQLLQRRGPAHPLWGAAVDDSHRACDIGRAWIWVKLPPGPAVGQGHWHGYPDARQACRALRSALECGAFYASTGLAADFWVEPALPGTEGGGAEAAGQPAVVVDSPQARRIRFVGPGLRVLGEFPGPRARYAPVPGDRFVRVELEGEDGSRAWSQPFWVTGGA